MIDKRLMKEVPKTKTYIGKQVLYQWILLLANIVILYNISKILVLRTIMIEDLLWIVLCLLLRFLGFKQVEKMGYFSSQEVKLHFRSKIFETLYALGPRYNETLATSQVVQLATEGIEQLEIYFAKYMSQFFYSMLAPLTLFLCIAPIDFLTAFVLFICVPLIPITIIFVQKIAKKILKKYWKQYTTLGDTFLENLQGLTTTKIYQSDAYKQEQMNREAEKFRIVTMKVLSMQLNSIIVMDVIAYGGAALGMVLSLLAYNQGRISLVSCIFILLISSEFFLLMRLLGSYFHIAMNGISASDSIFQLFSLSNGQSKLLEIDDPLIEIKDLSFAYDTKTILESIDLTMHPNSFLSIVGESGSGKSTLAGLLLNRYCNYTGSIKIGGQSLKDVDSFRYITYIGSKDYIFSGTIHEHLLSAKPNASMEECWDVLKRVQLDAFVKEQEGLDTKVLEQGSNLSGGQRQRLNLAKALLQNTPVYIFDEATSNIDIESEALILKEIEKLAKTKSILMISHRLENSRMADRIYVLNKGRFVEEGTFEECIRHQKTFYDLWKQQKEVMDFMEEVK